MVIKWKLHQMLQRIADQPKQLFVDHCVFIHWEVYILEWTENGSDNICKEFNNKITNVNEQLQKWMCKISEIVRILMKISVYFDKNWHFKFFFVFGFLGVLKFQESSKLFAMKIS